MSRFKLLGINDEQDSCCCCGKVGLKRVVWIEDTETGDIRHFGTSCAESPTKAFGLKSEIRKGVRDFIKAETKAAQDRRNEAVSAACRKACETFAGEWRHGVSEINGRTFRIPVDRAAFESHKQNLIAAALAELA